MKKKKKNRNHIKKHVKQNKVNIPQSNNKLTNAQLLFGLNPRSLDIVDTLDILRKNPPNIVIAKCLHDCSFKQNDSVIQKLEKKKNYVMNISMFANLEYNKYHTTPDGKPRLNLKPAKKSFQDLYKPYRGQELNNKRLLVLRTGGIGDLLFIQPNLRYLKQKYPSCKIIFATGLQYHSMVETWTDCIDVLTTLPFNESDFISCQYHLTFEGVIERTREAHTTNAYELFSKWMGLNLDKNLLRPVQEPNDIVYSEVRQILKNNFKLDINKNNKLCAIQLRASSPIRTPHPGQLWVPIINFLISQNYKIIITDNPAMHSQIENIINTFFKEHRDKIFNFTKHSQSISYSIALAKIVDMVVGIDSSLLHIAESVGTKNFGIYGPFPGSIRLSTYKYNDWIDCTASCAPCFTHGHRPCIYGGNNGGCSPCYQHINMSEFITKFKNLEIRNV